MAVTAGKNDAYQLHPIYQRGNRNFMTPENDNHDNHDDDMRREKNRILRKQTLHSTIMKDHPVEYNDHHHHHPQDMHQHDHDHDTPHHHPTTSMNHSHKIYVRHTGLNDIHGGHWIDNSDDDNNNDDDVTQFQKESNKNIQ
jgi:hypothetical protein